MSAARTELQEALCRYITDTLTCVHTVRGFFQMSSKWTLCRETELAMMRDIKDRVEKVNLNLDHLIQSTDKGKAFREYAKSKFKMADSSFAELEKELGSVVEDTLEGLEKLDCCLDAVEKLAVTSLHVFTENQVVNLLEEISFDDVQVVITASRLICPLLLEFKRDAKVFFLPKRQNLDVLIYQLEKYIQTTKTICEKMEKRCITNLNQRVNKVLVKVNVRFPKYYLQKMLHHVTQLLEIRKNQHFRMLFLFQKVSCSDFINEFEMRQSRMLRFLNELEECAVQLDSMSKGAKISSVAGSSVGAVGGALSIAGLVLIPFTAGLSAGLLIGGTVMGITSGVNSVVTTVTEIGVNKKYQNKANEAMKILMNEMQSLQTRLEQVTCQPVTYIDISYVKYLNNGAENIFGIIKQSHSLYKDVSDLKLIRNENVILRGQVVAQEGTASYNLSKVASDVPDVGKSAFKGTLATSKAARIGMMAANGLFLGMDIYSICKDSISLAKGSESEVSKFIRARAALWRSEINSWKKISDSLCLARCESETKKAALRAPFYKKKRFCNIL